ncbi:hypothetical protein SESBI_21325 [Sesbania bispinosa]|nr:hypothetical protein SESBI_21325 [Sesbania bispinosa]
MVPLLELNYEAGEIVLLEILREQVSGDKCMIPKYEGGFVFLPRNHVVNGFILHGLGWRSHDKEAQIMELVADFDRKVLLCTWMIERERGGVEAEIEGVEIRELGEHLGGKVAGEGDAGGGEPVSRRSSSCSGEKEEKKEEDNGVRKKREGV